MAGQTRYTHLIGGLTAPSAGDAMTTALGFLGPNRAVLGLVENAYGAQVTIATSCGLARRPDPAQVTDALEKMAALAAA